MDELVAKLRKVGFSPYEAKAFVALLQEHPANGYEIGERAGIPTSKIYGTLSRLVNKGIALVEAESIPPRYNPVPVHELAERFKREYRTAIEDIENELARVRPLPDLDLSWNIIGYESVVERMAELVRTASQAAYLSLWQKEHSRLAPEIKASRAKGVKVILSLFGEPRNPDPLTIAMAGCGVTSKARLKSRLSIAVADSREVVIAELDDKSESRGVWTTTPHVVVVAKEYIRHDIWGRILINELGDDRFVRLCEENPLLSYLIQNP